MNQRLYFLLPDREHAASVINDLCQQGFDQQAMHTIAGKGASTAGLPGSNDRQRVDFAGRLGLWGWRANLAVFFLAALGFVFMLAVQAGAWLLLPAAIMLASFVLGERFTRLPDTRLSEFRDALKHGEILLMVDTPVERVSEVEYRVHGRHPEAIAGGSSWNMPAMNA